MSEETRETIRFVLGAIALVAAVMFLFVGMPARAQAPPDVVTRPTAATATWVAGIADEGMAAATVCLFRCGDDYLDPAKHLSCSAVGPVSHAGGQATGGTGEVSNPFGAGDSCYRAVSVSATGAISEPSANSLTVLDLPLPPTFLVAP